MGKQYVYQVKDWEKIYENARSRDVINCTFVCMPNSQDGNGFVELMSEPDGTAIYGLFCAIVGKLSRQRPPRKGLLTSDGTDDGLPWTAQMMSKWWRRPVDEVERALEKLASDEVKWLFHVHESPNHVRKHPSHVHRRKEGRNEGKEGKPCDDANASRPDKNTNPAHKQFIEGFVDRWENAHGTKYPFAGGKDARAVKEILAAVNNDLEKALRIVDAYLLDDERFVSGHPLSKLPQGVAKYAAMAADLPAKVKTTEEHLQAWRELELEEA